MTKENKDEMNSYPALEEKYGEIAFEVYKRDQDLVDKIIENNNKMIEKLSKIPKPRKEKKL